MVNAADARHSASFMRVCHTPRGAAHLMAVRTVRWYRVAHPVRARDTPAYPPYKPRRRRAGRADGVCGASPQAQRTSRQSRHTHATANAAWLVGVPVRCALQLAGRGEPRLLGMAVTHLAPARRFAHVEQGQVPTSPPRARMGSQVLFTHVPDLRLGPWFRL